MAPPVVSLEYDDETASKLIKAIAKNSGDVRPALKEMREVMLLSVDENFQAERDPEGQRWPPNSPTTIARKKARGRIQRILQDTGRLRASIGARLTKDSVIVGTNVKYGAKHQLGDGVPARPFIGFKKEDRAEITRILTEHLIENSVEEAD